MAVPSGGGGICRQCFQLSERFLCISRADESPWSFLPKLSSNAALCSFTIIWQCHSSEAHQKFQLNQFNQYDFMWQPPQHDLIWQKEKDEEWPTDNRKGDGSSTSTNKDKVNYWTHHSLWVCAELICVSILFGFAQVSASMVTWSPSAPWEGVN